jgi:putative addiction module component (TIGR02574 family)
MSTTLEALQAEVLRLSPKDRAHLLDRLIASLDADAEAEAAWDAVAFAREAELNAGTVQAVPIDAALSRLESRFPG